MKLKNKLLGVGIACALAVKASSVAFASPGQPGVTKVEAPPPPPPPDITLVVDQVADNAIAPYTIIACARNSSPASRELTAFVVDTPDLSEALAIPKAANHVVLGEFDANAPAVSTALVADDLAIPCTGLT